MRNIIIVAGLPGSGKSSFAEWLAKKTGITMISKDEIKEVLFDTVGFKNREGKTRLNNASLELMFYVTKILLNQGENVILENNFENNAYPLFEKLTSEFDVNIVNIFVGGDSKTIYERFVTRNMDPNRHRGHVISTEYPEPAGKEEIPEPPIDYETFYSRFKERGMMDFHIGDSIIKVDATDFNKVSYNKILEMLYKKLS